MSGSTKLPRGISERDTTYRCPFMHITHQRAEFDGFAKDYYVVNFKRRGGVVALSEGRVLLVRQYRLLLNAPSWELPGGTIEDNEDIEAGMVRECVEETGVRPCKLKELIVYYPGLDNVDNRTTVFYSENVDIVLPFRENPAEVSKISWVPLERCLEMIFKQEILDAMTVAGLLAYGHILHGRSVKR